MHGRFSRFSVQLLPVCAAILLASCDIGSPTGPRILSLTVVAGNDQAGPVGAALSEPLTIRAIDQNGVPIAGVPLEWEVVLGNGSFVSAESVTDQDGYGQAIYRLGNVLGSQRVSVRVRSQTATIFRITATEAPASLLRAVSGDNQSGLVDAPLTSPIVVIVTDAVDNPKSGIQVNFTVTSGGGFVSSTTRTTDAMGLASVTWTLGPAVGAQTVTVTSTGLPSITFVSAAVQSLIATASADGRHGCWTSTSQRLHCMEGDSSGTKQLGSDISAASSGAVSAIP